MKSLMNARLSLTRPVAYILPQETEKHRAILVAAGQGPFARVKAEQALRDAAIHSTVVYSRLDSLVGGWISEDDLWWKWAQPEAILSACSEMTVKLVSGVLMHGTDSLGSLALNNLC